MPSSDDEAELFDACVSAAERVKAHGSPELQAAMRLVLFILGQDIAATTELVQNGSLKHPQRNVDKKS